MGQTISDTMSNIVTQQAFKPRPSPREYGPEFPTLYIARDDDETADSFIPILVTTPGSEFRRRETMVSSVSMVQPAATTHLLDPNLILATALHKRVIPQVLGTELRDSPLVMVISHGNGEDLWRTSSQLGRYALECGASFVCYEYPGYGCNIGNPTEISLIDDLNSCYLWLINTVGVNPRRVMLVGRSIGSGPTIALAKHCSDTDSNLPGGMLIISGFISVTSVVSPALASSSPAGDIFRNSEAIASVKIPTIIAHGSRDELVNVSHAHKLYENAKLAKRLSLLIIEGCGHNGLETSLFGSGVIIQFAIQNNICTAEELKSVTRKYMRSTPPPTARAYVSSRKHQRTRRPYMLASLAGDVDDDDDDEDEDYCDRRQSVPCASETGTVHN